METTIDKPKAKKTDRKMPMYKVLAHNDPITPAKFVIEVLKQIFRKEDQAAYKIMMEAHEQGLALVEVMPLEQAELRVEQVHSLAKTSKFPLQFSIEPE